MTWICRRVNCLTVTWGLSEWQPWMPSVTMSKWWYAHLRASKVQVDLGCEVVPGMCLPISHSVFSQPGAQVQVKPFTWSLQLPPFLHGWLRHSSMPENRHTTSDWNKNKDNFVSQYYINHSTYLTIYVAKNIAIGRLCLLCHRWQMTSI